MKRLITSLLCMLLITPLAYAQFGSRTGAGPRPVRVREADGDPTVTVGTIIFPNGTLTKSGTTATYTAAVASVEGTAVLSTGELITEFLRADGDGTSSWAVPAGTGDFLADGTVAMTGNFNINTQAIEDANSNELVTFITAASAVNNIQVTNSAAGDGVKLTAVGGDTDIDLHLEPKGIGIIRLEETLPSTAGQSLAEMMFDIDSSAQVSTSEFHAILVETTGTPAGEVAALGTVGQVDPIHQHVATFATPNQDEYAGKKTGGGADWVDGDTPVTGENLDANEIFLADDDEIYFGGAAQFDEVEVIMGTGATKNVNATFWYNTAADAWTQFFPDDGTNGFQQSGDIIWLLSGITGLWTSNGDPGGTDTTAGYWIKVIRTRVADPGSPTPTTVKIGLATTYSWDNTGVITALGFTIGSAAILEAELEILDGATITTAETDTLSDGSNADSLHVHASAGLSGIVNADLSGTAGITIANTAITAGRSLTWATNDIVADAELYTDTKCVYWEDPLATDDFKSIWTVNGFAATITKMWCESDQTVNMDLQIDDGSPADVAGTDLVCDATPAEDEAGLTGSMADGDRLDFIVTSVSGTPTWASMCWTVTLDD